MEKQFKEVEKTFDELKRKFRQREISRGDFIEESKKLKLKDEKGRFWMIGSKSGKWYYFDEKNWIQSEPPSVQEGKAICIYCGFENKLESVFCARCGGNLVEREDSCPKCGHKLDEPGQDCPLCSKEFVERTEEGKESFEEKRDTSLVIYSISPLSFLLFWGAIGLVLGIIGGAFTGATDYFSEISKAVPFFLQDFQGKLLGGIVYATLGGVLGFIVFGAFGFCIAHLINILLTFIGGIKIHIEKK